MFGIGIPELIILIFILAPFVVWVIALVDIIRFEFTGNNKVIWLLVVLLVPLFGSILYLIVGRKQKIDPSQAVNQSAGGKKFCVACGEELNALAEICPKCGVRQPAQNKQNSAALVILIVAIFFIGGIAVTGILAAIAIPQFAAYRVKAYNAAAISEVKNVKTGIEAFYVDNKRYPDSLDGIQVPINKDVDVDMKREGSDKYSIVAMHKKGSKIYMMNSDDTKLFYKEKNSPDSEFMPVQ